MDRAAGDVAASASALNSLGVLARNRGDLHGARSFFEESLHAYQRVGDTNSAAVVMDNLGRVARDQGDWASTVELSTRSLSLMSEMGDALGVAMPLSNLAVGRWSSAVVHGRRRRWARRAGGAGGSACFRIR